MCEKILHGCVASSRRTSVLSSTMRLALEFFSHTLGMQAPELPMKTARARGAQLVRRVCFSVVAAAIASFQAHATGQAAISPEPVHHASISRADFKGALPSDEARNLADWIIDSNDNRRLPFLIVDKKLAVVFAFHADARLRGTTPVLLGSAIGDSSAPGIGQRKLSAIRPGERTTPAGRFVAALDRNLQGVEILWVDYDAAISLHRVVTGTPTERRAQRLTSPTPLDNRISFGCINVPPEFFDDVVRPAFKGTNGIVYVLPETRPAREVFGSYKVDERNN